MYLSTVFIIGIDLIVAEIYTAHGIFEEREPNIEGSTELALKQ